MNDDNARIEKADEQRMTNDDEPDETPQEIEATFGPMSVYVSGEDTDDIEDTFENVWDTVMDSYREAHEMSSDEDEDGPSRTFG